MNVVADSHALLFFLFTPSELSDTALEALGEDEAVTESSSPPRLSETCGTRRTRLASEASLVRAIPVDIDGCRPPPA